MENKNFNQVAALSAINQNYLRDCQKPAFDCPPVAQRFSLEEESPIKEYQRVTEALREGAGLTVRNYQSALKGVEFPVFAKVLDTVGQVWPVYLSDVGPDREGNVMAHGFYFEEETSASTKYLKLDVGKISSIFPWKDKDWKKIYFLVPLERVIGIFHIPDKYLVDLTTAKLIQFSLEWTPEDLFPTGSQQSPQVTELLARLDQIPCTKCPLLAPHSKLMTQKKKLDLEIEKNRDEIKKIESKVGKSKFEALMAVLRDLGFTDSEGLATPKMSIAKAICSGPEVVLFTEIVSNNLIHQLSYIEIPVILALIDFETRQKEAKMGIDMIYDIDISEELRTKIEWVNEAFVRIKMVETTHGIVSEEFLNFDMVECIYNWMSGFEFRALSNVTEKVEGQILRCIYKIEKFLEKLIAFAETFDQKELKKTVEQSLLVIRRDILDVPSLYLTYKD